MRGVRFARLGNVVSEAHARRTFRRIGLGFAALAVLGGAILAGSSPTSLL